MKKILFLILCFTALFFTNCKKNNTIDLPTDTTTLQQLSKDDINVDNSIDESMNDASLIVGNNTKSQWLPCNATLDSVKTFSDTIHYYITYNGLNCSQKIFRQGNVIIKQRVHSNWIDAGTTIVVNHINFKVWKVVNPDKWIIINGTKSLKNVNGGLISELGYHLTSVIHKIEGYVVVTFENNTTKTWNIRRIRTFTGNFNDQKLMMTVDGFGSADGYDNLVTWGTTRDGENFYSQILTSVFFKQTCDWNPCGGIRKYSIPSDSKSATITYGYNDNNEPIVGDECPTKYKLDWVKGNKNGTLYLPLK